MNCPDCGIDTKVTNTEPGETMKRQKLECPKCGRRWMKTDDYASNVVRIEFYHPKGLSGEEKRRWYIDNNGFKNYDIQAIYPKIPDLP